MPRIPRIAKSAARSSLQRALLDLCVVAALGVSLMTTTGCQSGGGSVTGNEGGSEPVNETEANEYKKAVVRCYKTGGTRVVKVMGALKCY